MSMNERARERFRLPPLRAAEERFAWKMIGPSLIVLGLVSTIPLGFLLWMALLRMDLASAQPTQFVGLGNFVDMVNDDRFWHALGITLVYTISTVTLQVVLGLGLALALFRPVRGRGLLRVSVLLPMILAPVVVGLAWRTLILTQGYGALDFVAQTLGVGSQPWLTDPRLALLSVIIIHTWQWTPFAFLVFLATLNALPSDPLEAALVDRASPWQRFRFVILPMLRPAIIVVIVLRLIIALRAFAAIFSATGGGPGTATEILNLYAYKTSFNQLQLGYGASLAMVLLVVGVVVTLVMFRTRSRRMS
jgi:multiple sugar transport system permease protein